MLRIFFNPDGSREEYDDGVPEPVPQEVSRFQAKAALHRAGLLAAADAAAKAAGGEAALAWAEAVSFRRDSPTLNALAQGLSLTTEQVDALFRVAAGIEA